MFWHLPNCSQNVNGSRGPNMSIGIHFVTFWPEPEDMYIYIYYMKWKKEETDPP